MPDEFTANRFVWIKDQRGGYEPQKWTAWTPTKKDVPEPVAIHHLTEAQASLTLDELAVIFPHPPIERRPGNAS